MRLGLAVVRGASMEPTYTAGDVLLVGYGLAPRIGCPHLVHLPDGPGGPRPLSVKRLTREDTPASDGSRTWWVERDNPRAGVDSWLVGAIPDADVHARVLWRVPARLAKALLRT